MIHTYLGETIRYEIKYKKRKSVGIRVDSYGNVELQAPKGISNEKIVQLLEINWDVILKQVREMKGRIHGPLVRTYEQEEAFLYLGKSYPMVIIHEPNNLQDYVVLEENELRIHVRNQIDNEGVKQALKRFYYQQCKAIVEKSIAAYQHHFKQKPRSVRISDSKTTWGTCDSNLQLTFNWKLAMAPQRVIDYVVVHEMCHMVHLNHDRSFWRLVGKLMPDYKEQELWLATSSWKMTV